jgi:hypothetical protein
MLSIFLMALVAGAVFHRGDDSSRAAFGLLAAMLFLGPIVLALFLTSKRAAEWTTQKVVGRAWPFHGVSRQPPSWHLTNALRGLGLWILFILLTSVLVNTLFRERLNDPASRGGFGFFVILLFLGGTFGAMLVASRRSGTWATRLGATVVAQDGRESTVSNVETASQAPTADSFTEMSQEPAANHANLKVQYTNYNDVPWHRRSSTNSLFILISLLTAGYVPLTLWTCVNVLTGEVYYKDVYDQDKNLKVWSPANKVAAVIILLVNIGLLGYLSTRTR